MVHSKNKGAAGERELAKELMRLWNIDARRGQQFSGSPDSPDVKTSLERLHIECKRVESFRLYKSLEQAKADAGEDQIPLVMHRQSRKPWVVVMELDQLKELVKYLSDKI